MRPLAFLALLALAACGTVEGECRGFDSPCILKWNFEYGDV
jgi:hypothetical protein